MILQRRSEAEIRSLIIKAGRGSGLSHGHSVEISDLTPKLMSDPELMLMIVDSLSEDHQQIETEVSGKKILIKTLSEFKFYLNKRTNFYTALKLASRSHVS